MLKHFFFDLDNTVTRSRSPVAPHMRQALASLMASERDVIIVSGACVGQAREQLQELPCYYLGQNGNHAYDGKVGKDMWQRMLTPEEKREILVHIRSLPSLWNVRDPEDLLEDRGCQITYSFVGHHEVIDVKERFDPDRKKRKELLKRYPFRSNTVEIKLAGTTSFDYNQKGKHKGFNVSAFIKQMGWKKEECVYVGDALFPGGNDDSIVGVIETKAVENPTGTFDYVQSVLGSDNV